MGLPHTFLTLPILTQLLLPAFLFLAWQKPPRWPPYRACSVLWPGLDSLSSSNSACRAGSLQCPGPFKSIRLVARQQCGPRWSCTAEALPRPAWPVAVAVAGTEQGAAACRWWLASGKSGQGSSDRTRASRYVCGRDITGSPGAPLVTPDSPSKKAENQGSPGSRFLFFVFVFSLESPRLELASV